MRNFKIVGGILGAIALLVCTALIAVALLVNPNNFKIGIASKIRQATGREVQLHGDIKLSIFPWVSLELGSTTIGNPPGFADPVFLVFSHAALRVAVLPLLRHRLEVTRVEIDGLDLRLAKNAEGKGNWQRFDSSASPDPDQSAARSASESRLDALANLKIRNGRVSYESGVFQNLNLETGSLAADGHIPVTATVDADRGRMGEGISANVKFDLSEDTSGERILLSAINLSGTLTRPGDGRPAHWDLSAPRLEADLTRRTLAATAFTLSYANAHVAGSALTVDLADAVSVTGSATLAPLVLQEFAPRLGAMIPKTRDPRAFSQLSASADFSFAANEWQLKNLQGRLDDSTFTGILGFAAEPARLTFDLAVDRIDLNRYAAPETGVAPPAAAENGLSEKPESLDMHGTFKVQGAQIAHLNLTAVSVTVVSHDEVIHVYPLEALIDGGRYSGDITVDHRRTLPTVSMDEHLTGIDMTRLLADGALKGRISGRANLNLKGTARGASAGSLLKSLNGEFNADLSDGYFEGTDLSYEFARAQALIERTPMAGHEDTRRTKFDAVNLSGQIVNGIAESRDLLVSSPVLKVSGQGTANLATRALNVQLLASLLKSPGQSVVDVPFKITGTYVDPSVKADVEALAKGQLKQKLQDVLKKNGLEGLFGK